MSSRPIAIGLSPNTNMRDYREALMLLLQPWKWKQGNAVEQVEEWFKAYFRVAYAISFNAGRSALFAILKALGVGKGDEILVQAFTCVAVPNSVLWTGAKAVFVDIDASLNIDTKDAEEKITPSTRALIVQHTFGVPADMEKIVAFCKKHKLFLIEDCAHALGATYKGKLVGTFGDASFFSFGRDKIVSSVFGGLVTTKNTELARRISEYRNTIALPSSLWILRQLLHPIVMAAAFPVYNTFNLGKAIIVLFQKTKLLSFPVYPEEKNGKQPADFPKQYPNALAQLALRQLNRLPQMQKRRHEIAAKYQNQITSTDIKLPTVSSGSVFLRFAIVTKRADELRFRAKKQKILLGTWYRNVIDPNGVDMDKVGYQSGSCPVAERTAKEILNLPTYPELSDSQVAHVIKLLKSE